MSDVYSKCQRSTTLGTEVYKAVNGMTPNYIQELPYNLRNPTRTIIPKSNSTIYVLNSLTHEGNKIWNRLNIREKSYF